MKTLPVYIVDELQVIVDRLNAKNPIDQEVFYMYGHPKEIAARLQELTNGITTGEKKYPLIALFTDIPIEKGTTNKEGIAKLNLIIATLTEPELTAPERQERNFVPVLYPIYQELLEQLCLHPQFFFKDREVTHTKIDRFFWGTADQGFNDYIDAIELKDVRVEIEKRWDTEIGL